MKNNYISFDLSGTGTTACFDGVSVSSYKSKNWIDHLNWISYKISKTKNRTIIFETLTKIRKMKKTSKDLVDIAQLIGAIRYKYKKIFTTTAFMTHFFRKKILENEKSIKYLTYKKTKYKTSWFFKEAKINEHELDSIIIFNYGRAKKEGVYF